MKLIHRHILANVVVTCGWGVGLFAFVLMIGNVVRDMLGYIVTGQLPFETCVRLIALMVPVMVSYALPMGMLTGILLVLGRMSSDREVTALRASGVSVAWLSAPILFCALLGVVLNLAINFEFMPRAKVAYEVGLAEALQKDPLNFIVPKTFISDFPGIVIYAGEKKGSQLKDFWLWELDGQKRVKRFARAASGHLDFDRAHSKLVLTLEHAQVDLRNAQDPENFSTEMSAPAMQEATFDLPLDKLIGTHSVQPKLKWLTFSQLMTKWHQLDRPDPARTETDRAKEQMRVQITIHEKFATAFSVLSFALIAVPLGIKVSRKETSANLGIGVALTMAYFFATIVVSWFDNHPTVRPDLLMWLPNIGLQTLGIWMFYKVDRA